MSTLPEMHRAVRSSTPAALRSAGARRYSARRLWPSVARMTRRSCTTSQPVGVCQVDSTTDGAGHVTAVVGDGDVGGPEPERPGRTVEQRAEHAGRVGTGQAQPLDASVRRDQAAVLAVGEEGVVGDGGKAFMVRCSLLVRWAGPRRSSGRDATTGTTVPPLPGVVITLGGRHRAPYRVHRSVHVAATVGRQRTAGAAICAVLPAGRGAGDPRRRVNHPVGMRTTSATFRTLRERGTRAEGECHDTARQRGHRDQAGTCRFGVDPATSVLDVDCKAHELDNLYVVDTSFFPSIGAVNPALTAMANAIRVGEHLVGRLG